MQMSDADLMATLAALAKYGSTRKAAVALGLPRSTMRNRVDAALLRFDQQRGTFREDARGKPVLRVQARRGEIGGPPIPEIGRPPEGFAVRRNSAQYDGEGRLQKQWVETARDAGAAFVVPPGHVIKGESALTDADGRVIAKWTKTREGSGAGLVEALQEAFAAYSGAAPAIVAPVEADDETWTIYPVPDLHLGMQAWGAETGADYDLKIAIGVATTGIAELVRQSRPSSHATLMILGDFQHANDQRNVTPGSGHQLDVDGRHAKIYLAGANLAIALVALVAAKHATVEVVVLPGNHDPEAAVTLAVALSLYYSMNERISVNMKPGVVWYRRFGRCLLGAHHGHTMKPDKAAMAMAVDRHEDWGHAPHRYIFTGHFHSERVTEVGNVRVETLQSPAARDAWNTASGYRAGRSLSAITFHRDHGEVGRHQVKIGRTA